METRIPPSGAVTVQSKEFVHTAINQFSSAVLTMKSVEDLEPLVVTLWVELQTLSLNLDYCGINIFHESSRTSDFYGVHQKGLMTARGIPFSCCLLCDGLPTLDEALLCFKKGQPLHYHASTIDLHDWTKRISKLGIEVSGPLPPPMEERIHLVDIPFSRGAITMGRRGEIPFDEETIAVAQSFAQILSFGYARYEDLQKLESQNKDLKVGMAINRVHTEVMTMEKTGDWGKVLSLMRKELLNLGMNFTGCAINIIDEEAQRFRLNIILPAFIRKKYKPSVPHHPIDDETDLFIVEQVMEPGRVPSTEAMHVWKNKTVSRRILQGETLLKVAERSRQTMGFAFLSQEDYPRCLLDVPFSHGLISLSTPNPSDLTEADEKILQQMAHTMSAAYTRLLDIQELEKKNRELEEAQAQLVQSAKLAAMGELVAGVAHEINSPLGTINSNLDVTRRAVAAIRREIEKSDGGAPAKSEEMFHTIENLMDLNKLACERIMRIVRDLKNFARLDEAEFKEANLNENLESTLSLIHHQLKERIEVIREFSELPLIHCYPNRLNQVFMNLLVNAYQAIEGKGKIRIRTAVENGYVIVAISDSGHGIKPENLQRIYDPGFTTKGVGVGTGLGLSISARIVQEHQGTITVESELGKGTTFKVSLPIYASNGTIAG